MMLRVLVMVMVVIVVVLSLSLQYLSPRGIDQQYKSEPPVKPWLQQLSLSVTGFGGLLYSLSHHQRTHIILYTLVTLHVPLSPITISNALYPRWNDQRLKRLQFSLSRHSILPHSISIHHKT